MKLENRITALCAVWAEACAQKDRSFTVLIEGLSRDLLADRSIRMVGPDIGVDIPDADGRTALMKAAQYGDTEVIMSLMAAGADVNEIDKQGRSALMWAIEGGPWKSRSTLALIAAGADVNERDCDGNTPLMLAACNGCAVSVEALIAVGADVNAKNHEGKSVTTWVQDNPNRISPDSQATILSLLKGDTEEE